MIRMRFSPAVVLILQSTSFFHLLWWVHLYWVWHFSTRNFCQIVCAICYHCHAASVFSPFMLPYSFCESQLDFLMTTQPWIVVTAYFRCPETRILHSTDMLYGLIWKWLIQNIMTSTWQRYVSHSKLDRTTSFRSSSGIRVVINIMRLVLYLCHDFISVSNGTM